MMHKEKVRIALVGNMNNNHTALLYGFLGMGMDADLFLGSREGFQPSAEPYYPEIVGRLHYCVEAWPEANSLIWLMNNAGRLHTLVNTLKTYDLVTYCYNLHALFLFCRLHVPAVWLPYGHDYDLLFNKHVIPGPFQPKPSLKSLARYAQNLLLELPTRHFLEHRLTAIAGNYGDLQRRNTRNKLAVLQKHLNLGFYCVDYTRWFPRPAFQPEKPFIVISTARHIWKDRPADDISYKGNDLVIRAFAAFLHAHVAPCAVLQLFEKGQDVDASKQLIEEPGIASQVHWFPTLPRGEVQQHLSKASVYLGQFAQNKVSKIKVNYGMSEIEAAMFGIPAITYFDRTMPEIFPGKEMPPFLYAENVEDIAEHLTALYSQPSIRVEFAEKERAWYERHHGKGVLEKLLELSGKREPSPRGMTGE